MRHLVLAVVFSAFLAAAYGFGRYLFPILVPDMRVDLGLDYRDVGVITALVQAGSMASALSAGFLSQRLGALRIVIASITGCGVLLMALSRIDHPLLLAVVLTCLGGLSAAAWVPMIQVVGRAIPLGRRALVFGLLNGSGGYGTILNGVLVPAVLAQHDWRAVWVVAGSLTLAAALAGTTGLWLAGVFADDRRRDRERDSPAAAQFPWHAGLAGSVRRFAALWPFMFLSSFAGIAFQTYLSPMVREELGYSVLLTGQLWTTLGVVGVAGGIVTGIAMDRVGVRNAVYLLAALLAAANALIALQPGKAALFAAVACFAVAFYGLFASIPAYISKASALEQSAAIFGLGNVVIALGSICGNYAGGLLKAFTGTFQWTYVAGTACAVCLALLMTVLPDEARADEAPAMAGSGARGRR